MRHEFTNFTRGSQLLGHFGFMFAAGLKGPLLVTAAVFAGLIWWRASSTLSDHEAYLCWMRVYAWIYGWFEFNPDKAVNLNLASGGHIQLTLSALPTHPLLLRAWGRLMAATGEASALAACISIPAIAAFAWVAAWFGRRSKESRHERGATLAELPQLATEIAAHNRVKRADEYRRVLGWSWRLTSALERQQAGLYEPYALAGVSFPWRLEQSHAMLIGTTGTGKTVALRDLLSQVRDRSARAVVFDLTGAFIEAFYDPARDTILNPLDARCPMWSVFEDCTEEASLTAAAEALVPHDGGGAEQFWVLAARMLFVEMCLKLMREGRATNAALSAELMTASLSHVHKLMEGTVADPLTAPEAARMAESIRAVFNANAKALRMLPTSGEPFSVRRWVEGASGPGAMLFVSARYVDMPVASRLLTVWMDTAMTTLMSGPRCPDLKLWFLFDELGALHRLPAIEKGLQTARNYGGAIVAGVHAYAKLKETYGDNMAMTLAALARTKLILATADRESATWCSDFIGHRQYRQMEEGFSYGYNNARDAVSLTPRRQIEPLLLPDQLMNLPSLDGFLKFPDGFPAAPVRLRPRPLPSVADPFVPRSPMPHPGHTPTLTSAADRRLAEPGANASSDQGPGPGAGRDEPRPGRAQRPMPLFDSLDEKAADRSTSDPLARSDTQLTGPLDGPVRRDQGRPPVLGTGTGERASSTRGGSHASAPGAGQVRPQTLSSGRTELSSHHPGNVLPTAPAPENLTVRELKSGAGAETQQGLDEPDLEA
ncbi:type IV secretion system DNA-binding domain-containing protein [Sphingomonas sp. ID1715]|uniref:type IV secretion system DNA-binding domain-containing protein n=1 Tax=Sphingomonas sp. ID1715 TaxID=1656898 RepID=UPI001487F829|nr:type IV secretion system DNA-binding domain-containing protein [Sphingomonas sp. ID1715]NNM78042.1 type IV secretion system DNA-binding domain-containing protein [Sphingomonas sp. ID1715]